MAVNKRLLQDAAAGGLVPSEHFGVVLYEGDGTSSHSITGLNFTPDLVWIKPRSFADNHVLSDSTRGNNKSLASNNTAAEQTTLGVASFDTGGFTLPNWGNVNDSGEDFVAWCWKANGGTTSSNTDGGITSTVQANQDAGFSIIKYTATASGTQTVGHGLGVAPELIIQKKTSGSEDWYTYIPPPTIDSNYNYLVLNSTAVAGTTGSAVPTSSVFNPVSQSGDYIAYAFKSIDGFSKIGTYTGNADANGPIIETGFEPAFLMIKGTSGSSATTNWSIFDNKRNLTNPRDNIVWANLNNAESNFAGAREINFYSNGFQPVSDGSDDINDSSTNYIYMAFAADPDTEAPTVAKSFSTVAYTGNSSTQSIEGLGFSPNLVWIKGRNNTYVHGLYDTIRGSLQRLRSNGNQTNENVPNSLTSFDSDGFTLGSDIGQNQSANNYVAWAWKADDNEPTIYGGPALAVYKFEDNANDVTGDYNATANNITYTSSGKFNKAADFNGTNSYAETSLTTNLTSFTWSCWINPDVAWSGDITTIVKGFYSGASNTNYQYLGYTGGDFRFQFRDNTSLAHVSSSVTPAVGQWSHIVATVDGGTSVKIYINGVLTGSGTNSRTISNTNAVSIGGASSIFGPFDGQIDQVRIYQGAIAQEQVTELYNESASQNDDLSLGAPPETIISANANAGFSIVKWTGTGTRGFKTPHGLSAAPELIILKDLSATNHWVVGNSQSGWTKAMHLDLSNGDNTSDAYWFDTAPTSTVFTTDALGTAYNVLGNEYIAYCFHSVSGYSKIGSYTGNGSSQSITTGFQPDWLMFKRTDQNGWYWEIFDTVRGIGVDLAANTSAAEQNQSPANRITINTDGFTHTTANYHNISGASYIYMAFKIN